MLPVLEAIQRANREHAEALMAAAVLQSAAALTLASLNVELLKNGLDSLAAGSRALLAARDARELFEVQASLVQAGMRNALEYWQGANSVMAHRR
jgi:phasin family protein